MINITQDADRFTNVIITPNDSPAESISVQCRNTGCGASEDVSSRRSLSQLSLFTYIPRDFNNSTQTIVCERCRQKEVFSQVSKVFAMRNVFCVDELISDMTLDCFFDTAEDDQFAALPLLSQFESNGARSVSELLESLLSVFTSYLESSSEIPSRSILESFAPSFKDAFQSKLDRHSWSHSFLVSFSGIDSVEKATSIWELYFDGMTLTDLVAHLSDEGVQIWQPYENYNIENFEAAICYYANEFNDAHELAAVILQRDVRSTTGV